MPSAATHFGGARYTESATDFALNWAGAKVHTINATATGVGVTMPTTSAHGLAAGSTFYLVNGGNEAFTVRASGGSTIATCPTGEALRLRIIGDGSWASEQMDSDGQPPDDDPPAGEVLATVTARETRPGFNLIRGTIPVPDDRIPSSLFLRDSGGTAWPTEVHTVIRGPGGVPRVLELRSRIDCGAGGSVQFDVEGGLVESTGSFHDDIVMQIAANAPDSELDPTVVGFTNRLLNAGASTAAPGAVTNTVRKAGELLSGSGSRLFGYEAFVTTVAGEPDVWLVDMTIMNANVGSPFAPLGSNILHHVYFDAIQLQLPAGYQITHLHSTPYTSSTHLMTALTGGDAGKYHILRQGGGKQYRFAVHKASPDPSFARAQVLLNHYGFFTCDHSKTLWSWTNPSTAFYGPHQMLVPEMDLSGYHPYGHNASNKWGTSCQWTNIRDGYAAGTSIPFITGPGGSPGSTPAGPYHIMGPTDPGYSGGDMITAFTGYEVVNSSAPTQKLRAHMIVTAIRSDRAAGGNLSSDTGFYICDSNQAPIDCGQWNLANLLFINNPGKMNSNHQGPWPRLNANQWRFNNASGAGKLPPYNSTLNNFGLIKDSHIIRATGSCVPLIWFFNDPLAKTMMAHVGSWGRMHTLEYSNPNVSGSTSAGLPDLYFAYEWSANNVQNWPDRGSIKGQFGGRIGGWAIWTQCIDWLSTDNDTKRANYGPWFAMLKAHDTLAQFKVGSKNWQAWNNANDHPVETDLGGQWTTNGYSGTPNACASQTIECGIRAGAVRAVQSCTGDAEYSAMLSNACDGIWDFHWKPGTSSAHFVVPVRPLDDVTKPAWTTRYPGTGDPNGTVGGIAPDCFTDNTDNDQVGTMVAAALDADPNHAKAWQIIYAVTGQSTQTAARDDLLALFPLKMAESWGPVLAKIQDILA